MSDETTTQAEETTSTENGAHQQEMPFALVQGEPLTQIPQDLYIPPDALEIFLDAFEGPLDLLLYLIKRQNLDILDIPIADITRQYMEYVELMKELRLELAAEYLVMAASLAEIKSRMLLPRQVDEEGEEEDPRAELIRRLQEYERYKNAAQQIDALPRMERDYHGVKAEPPERTVIKLAPTIDLQDMIFALKDVMSRAQMYSHHHIQLEPLSVRERMSNVLSVVKSDHFVEFTSLFTPEEGRGGVIVTLLAILELLKASLIEMVQSEPFGAIHVKAAATFRSVDDTVDLETDLD
jgi:segregation and condensation protein A